MKRNRIYFGLLLFILLVIIAWSSLAMLNVGKTERTFSVSVIVNDSNNDRWIALREGLEQAAQDYNIELNYVSTGNISDMEEEMALIQREADLGADGMIVQMVGSEVSAEQMATIDGRTALMLIETDVMPEGLYPYIGFRSLTGKKIGILAGNQEQIAMQQRLDGLETALDGIEIEWMIPGQPAESAVDILAKQRTSPVDVIVALGNSEVEVAVDYLLTLTEEEKAKISLYGAGCSEKAVYYLDKGIISSLVVPNEFNMGYQSMEEMARQLEYRLSDAESQTVDYLVVDRTNLYDADNQKVLFPIVQ